jgi:3,4-dihydroxy 2-butanone 4-phosphate synthase/GTP cyclohydrolase II
MDAPAAGRRLLPYLAQAVAESVLPTRYGQFRCFAFQESAGLAHLALVLGETAGAAPLLVRVHSECLTGDVFGSLRCDCGPQLEAALERIAREGRGVVVYLRGQEGRGIGLFNKVRAYRLQDKGYDTCDANLALGLPVDARQYNAAARILAFLDVTQVRLLTNNPDKVERLGEGGVSVVAVEPLQVPAHPDNDRYLRTKQRRLRHRLLFPADED